MLPSNILPDHPISLSRNVITTPKAYFWSTPVLLALAIFMLVWEAPGIIRDFRISQNPLVVDGDVRDGRCTTRKGVFTDCKARLVYSYHGRDYDSEVEIMFVDFHIGDYDTGLVIAADRPELATMTLGLDKLWNRIITLIVFVSLLGALSLGMVFLALRIVRVKAQLKHPARLVPVPVEITAFNRNRKGLFVTYADTIAGDRTKRSAYTRLPPGQEPLIIGEAKGKALAMAVRHGKTALPVLLDEQLERLELTDAERSTALQQVSTQLPQRPTGTRLVEPSRQSMPIWKRLQLVLGMLALLAVGVFGFWLWYVLASSTQFQSPGMDINNMMPGPLNAWGCEQLEKRFGQDRAPFGCTADDYISWK